ncbi:hypothetical protein C8R45DRAFT_578724 [Mycena sanguinolenta]|nr:hypothetical protein C8R45DRAFT_578724 [Mycena sanguinolenta]
MLDFMEADRTLLCDLNAKIHDPECSPSELCTEQAQAQEKPDAFTYPVLTLPNDITSEIFTRFVPVYPAVPPLTGIASPTTLTHVCRQWRQVALATPALWRAIYNSGRELGEIRDMAKTWIKRSEPYPLSIEINVDSPDVLRGLLMQPSAITTGRWAHLKLRIPSSFSARLGLSSMPILQSLDFFGTLSLFLPYAGFAFYDVPQLRTVCLSDHAVSKISLPWEQLTSLTLLCVHAWEGIKILRQVPNLVTCALRLRSRARPESDLPLLCLEPLTLTLWTSSLLVTGFFASFVTPCLRKLGVHDVFLGAEPISTLGSFILKSGCSLQEVCITGDMTTARCESYRRAFPSIPTFSFPDECEEEDDGDTENCDSS